MLRPFGWELLPVTRKDLASCSRGRFVLHANLHFKALLLLRGRACVRDVDGNTQKTHAELVNISSDEALRVFKFNRKRGGASPSWSTPDVLGGTRS